MSRSFSYVSARTVVGLSVVLALFALFAKSWTTPALAVHAPESKRAFLPNYDIRLDKEARSTVAAYRTALGRSSTDEAAREASFESAKERLARRVPTLKIEMNPELKTPEVIAPDVTQGRAYLTERRPGASRADALKSFLGENADLVSARQEEINELKVFSDYENPDGKLAFVELNQEVNGVPVFRGEVKAGFTESGEIVRVVNNFVPGLDGSVSTDFGDPAEAITAAYRHAGDSRFEYSRPASEAIRSEGNRVQLGEGDFAPVADKIYFPTEAGVAVPAWRVLVTLAANSYYVITDAQTGTLLWRKNLTDHQSQSASYNVYVNPNAMANIAHSPFPMSPGTTSLSGLQATGISRTLVTRVGNEAPYAFNNLGWITDGTNSLDGNNVQAGLDRIAPNTGSLDANAIDAGSVPAGSPNRVFNYPINPSVPTNPALQTGDAPLPAGQSAQQCLAEGTVAVPTDFQKAVTTQLFYISNVFHDEMYRLGFTEAARNFQNDNFGRGGLGGDRVSAQAQDCSGINNANFTTPADGQRPQMQMFLWSGPNPDIDGSLDADVIVHELTHGVSNRLHGNSSGLFMDIARGMGEGWSDFYAHCLLSTPSDPIDGVYTIGSYDTYLFGTVGFNNNYYGIRRFPRAIFSATGGPQNRPHNPLTFADIDSTRLDLGDGAFAPRYTTTADQVHSIGEVWSSALWEIRARMIQRLGWEVGNRRILQFVTDGMKLAPLGPTPLSERDALIAAIFASGTEADLADAWAGFAIRGFGAAASIESIGGISTGGTGTIRVTESFAAPNLSQSGAITVTDSNGDNDGYPEPGENVTITIPITNATGTAAAGVSAQVANGPALGNLTMGGRSTAAIAVTFTIPSTAACGANLPLTITLNSSLGPISFERGIFVGRPNQTTPAENFDGVAAGALPTGWTAVPVSGGINFENVTNSPDSTPNVMYARNPTANGGGSDLTAPPISVTSDNATVSFRHKFNTETGWDGGILEISIAGSEYQDFTAAGGAFVQNGYNGIMSGGRNNPIASREGWTGNSNGYRTTIAQFPSAAAGKVVSLRWRFGADDNTPCDNAAPNVPCQDPNPGWYVDTISLSGAGFVSSFVCQVAPSRATVSGKVTTPSGAALRNAVVVLTPPSGAPRRVTTGSFGLFAFADVDFGAGYVLSVGSKRYRFAPRTLDISGNLINLEMIGQE